MESIIILCPIWSIVMFSGEHYFACWLLQGWSQSFVQRYINKPQCKNNPETSAQLNVQIVIKKESTCSQKMQGTKPWLNKEAHFQKCGFHAHASQFSHVWNIAMRDKFCFPLLSVLHENNISKYTNLFPETLFTFNLEQFTKHVSGKCVLV